MGGCWVRNVPGTFYVRECTMRLIVSLHKTATLLKTRRFWLGALAYEGSILGKNVALRAQPTTNAQRPFLYKCLPVEKKYICMV
jgi:hypothetical protein